MRTCDKCVYFKITAETQRIAGQIFDLGTAECKKHNLVADFLNHGKFKRLKICEDYKEVNGMPHDFGLKEYTEKEYEIDMKQKLAEKGLYKAVEEILNEIMEENANFNYAHFSLMSELACDILKLIELSEGGKNNG